MDSLIFQLIPALWLAWLGYWGWASRGNKPAQRTETLASRLQHVLPLVLAVALIWAARIGWAPLDAWLWPWQPAQYWAGAALTAAGLLFTVWARRHLGRNWSGVVTIKRDHELVCDGPYALVRHPIYTGLLLAFVGSALARGQWRGVLAVALVLLAFWRKLRLEERWMRETFGARYEAYAGRVAALIPFVL